MDGTSDIPGPIVTFYGDITGIWTGDVDLDGELGPYLVCNGVRLDWNMNGHLRQVRVRGDERALDPFDHLLTFAPAAKPEFVAGLFGQLAPSILCAPGGPDDEVDINLRLLKPPIELLFKYSKHHALLDENRDSFEPIRHEWMNQVETVLLSVLPDADEYRNSQTGTTSATEPARQPPGSESHN